MTSLYSPSGHSRVTLTTIRKIVLITSMADTLPNFRGPLIACMAEAGIEVLAMAPDYDDRTRAAVRAFGGEPVDISLDRTGMRPMRDAGDVLRLAMQLRRLKPDATFSYFIKPVIYGSLAAWMAGVRCRFAMVAGLGYIFTPDGSPDRLKRRLLKWVASSFYRLGFRVCNKVFFQNLDDEEQFVGGALLPKSKTVLINGSGVDLDRLAHVPPARGQPVFLLMARLLREKGIYEYAEAARLVKRLEPNARFILLGKTDLNPGGLSEEEVKSWADEGIIEWPGHVDDVRPWIEQSCVYVLPSWREGKPRSTQEAMAIGRAIITTDAPGCRDTVDPGLNGILVPVRDPNALAAAMMRFILEPDLVISMGAASRKIAEERFDVRKINRRILSEAGILNFH
jgi:glycosyltransferase involved in cell wall biosynthesis